MLNRLFTLFILSLLVCGLAASPVNQPRTLWHFRFPIYYWPFRYWPFHFPRPGQPKPSTTQGPQPITTKPGPTASTYNPGPTPSTYNPGPSTSIVLPGPSSTILPGPSSTVQPGPSSSTVQPGPSSSTVEPGPSSSSSIQPNPTTTNQPNPTSSSTTPPVPTSSSTTPGTTIPFGEVIKDCKVEGTVALTFDDGPFDFTNQLLDIFQQNGAKATLFVNGQNFGSITDYSAVMLRAFNEGHQIGSHSFGHAHLSQLNRDQLVSEMTRLDDALAGIIGGNRPTYMRAPFFEYSDLVLQTMKELNYHVIDASVDTKDFEHNTPEGVPISVQNLKEGLDQGGDIVLAHDVHQTTVQLLAQQMIDEVKKRGLRMVTVGECLGDPKENWYRRA